MKDSPGLKEWKNNMDLANNQNSVPIDPLLADQNQSWCRASITPPQFVESTWSNEGFGEFQAGVIN